ncbi:ATP-dependent helicase [Terriglobus roseus]|uniref:DNA 3'-5' helicase n=1 Tax=Terriglobus roseus TaxID=392734 RepID=A0A1G7LUX8_9BACT|nr:UvrD-helicase domain-containing protein [Terriglobus roseus]SDF53186.1 DNA helicase-2 / ATP-dependent DNA helicase PcrA [Terriglobus roseus]
MSRFLEKMNPQQQEGVLTVDGPVLLLAGAGSGKTRVITHRIAHLIEDKGVPADSILAVTFTNKAAKEMAERVDGLIGHSSLAKPLISTFHSLCVRTLRRDIEALRVNGVGLTKSFAIYDESDQQAIVKQALKRLGVDDKQLKPRVALGRISWAKNHMIDPQEYFLASTNPLEERIAHIFKIYKEELNKNNAMDFDDLLLETVRLLKTSQEVRERYQRKYRYLLIDEYQDTNRPQYELMRLLSGKHGNVCVVGDEDQSIYSWRGADIKNILDFEKDFENTKIIRLEQNYRSTQIILEGAGAVVRNNTQRKGKELYTTREGGSLIGYYEAPDGENEALFIADRIATYIRETTQAGDTPKCAVLYRTNSQSRLVEESLRRYNIQYHMVGGFSFYDRAEVKDLLSYLKLVQNPNDSIALNRVVNSPPRGIGKTTMETLERIALTTGMSTWEAIDRAHEQQLLPGRALTALKNFQQLIKDARAMLGPGFDEALAIDAGLAAAPEFIGEEENVSTESDANEDTSFDTSFNFGFDFGPTEERSTIAPENAHIEEASFDFGYTEEEPLALAASADGDSDNTSFDFSFNGNEAGTPSLFAAPQQTVSFNPFEASKQQAAKKGKRDNRDIFEELREKAAPIVESQTAPIETSTRIDGFRAPGDPATLPELIKFLNDRSGYIKQLENEGTPEAFSRIENLKELANAAQDAQERGETLADFLDHAALVSDADSINMDARVTLMTLHASKGLEFPLVFLCGMEEGLFPSSRTLQDPNGLEEERRLCYVGMTRAMDTLVLTRARYRRRYGSDMPDASVGSRFLEEIPSRLVEDLGSPEDRPAFRNEYGGNRYGGGNRWGKKRGDDEFGERHYSYEDEDQSGATPPQKQKSNFGLQFGAHKKPTNPNSIDNIASFFGGSTQFGGHKRPKMDIPEATGSTELSRGAGVRHPKYGEGRVVSREGSGSDAKITVEFRQHGVKKLVEKFAQLEKL